jgi:hypothetical protein
VAAEADPFAFLTLAELRKTPFDISGVTPFVGAGDKWWVRDGWAAKLFGFDSPEPERVVTSLHVATADRYAFDLAFKAYEDGLAVASLTDGTRLFRVPFTDLPISPRAKKLGYLLTPAARAVAASDSELVVVVTDWEEGRLFVLDRASGAELWQAPWLERSEEAPAFANGAVYLREREGYTARDARSGERIWMAPTSLQGVASLGPRIFGTAVALSLRASELTLVEARSGLERCSLALASTATDALLLGKQIVLTLPAAAPATQTRFAGFDSDTCRLLWMSRPLETVHRTQQRAIRDHLLVESGQHMLVLDQRGVVVWHYGLPHGQTVAFDIRQGVLRVASVSAAAWQPPRLINIFHSGDAPAPVEDVTVRGTVMRDDSPAADVRVVAYGVATQTDVTGRYELRFRARGKVAIHVPDHGAEQTLELSGKRSYLLDVSSASECGDCE